MIFQKTLASVQNGLTIALVGLALGGFTLAGCDSAGSSNDGGDVEVGFSSTASSSTTSATRAKADGLLVVGDANGDTLQIDDIRFIVSEVELDGEADSAEFETEKPAFVDLPLNSSDVVPVVNGQIPPGTYNEFEFEVEDADLDDDEDEEEVQQLRADIEDAGFTEWPNAASLVVVGSFTPSGGDAQPFTTYLDAEIEVEIEMDGRTFEVGGDDPSRQLTINLSPSNWFVSDGNPVDLSAPEYQNPGDELPEFEIEFEEETEVEFDDD